MVWVVCLFVWFRGGERRGGGERFFEKRRCFFRSLRSDRKERKERALPPFCCSTRVFFFVSLLPDEKPRCSSLSKARERKRGEQGRSLEGTKKGNPFLFLFSSPSKKNEKLLSLSHLQDLLLKCRLVDVEHRPDGEARRAGRRGAAGRPPCRREGGRIAADSVAREGAAECGRGGGGGRRRGASSRGQRRRGPHRPRRSRPRGRRTARRRRVHRRHHGCCAVE